MGILTKTPLNGIVLYFLEKAIAPSNLNDTNRYLPFLQSCIVAQQNQVNYFGSFWLRYVS